LRSPSPCGDSDAIRTRHRTCATYAEGRSHVDCRNRPTDGWASRLKGYLQSERKRIERGTIRYKNLTKTASASVKTILDAVSQLHPALYPRKSSASEVTAATGHPPRSGQHYRGTYRLANWRNATKSQGRARVRVECSQGLPPAARRRQPCGPAYRAKAF
jgi:hypothetical protein